MINQAEKKQFIYSIVEVPESKVRVFESFCLENRIYFKFSHVIFLHD